MRSSESVVVFDVGEMRYWCKHYPEGRKVRCGRCAASAPKLTVTSVDKGTGTITVSK